VEGEEGRGWEVSGVGNPANSTPSTAITAELTHSTTQLTVI